MYSYLFTIKVIIFSGQGVTKRIGRGMHELAAKVDEYARGMMGPLGSTLFEELGLYYIGPVDGHNIEDLICVLQEVSSLDSMGPVLVHVITEENQGLENCQKSEITGKQLEGRFHFSSFFPAVTAEIHDPLYYSSVAWHSFPYFYLAELWLVFP